MKAMNQFCNSDRHIYSYVLAQWNKAVCRKASSQMERIVSPPSFGNSILPKQGTIHMLSKSLQQKLYHAVCKQRSSSSSDDYIGSKAPNCLCNVFYRERWRNFLIFISKPSQAPSKTFFEQVHRLTLTIQDLVPATVRGLISRTFLSFSNSLFVINSAGSKMNPAFYFPANFPGHESGHESDF